MKRSFHVDPRLFTLWGTPLVFVICALYVPVVDFVGVHPSLVFSVNATRLDAKSYVKFLKECVVENKPKQLQSGESLFLFKCY